jgi:putative phosphoesterase
MNNRIAIISDIHGNLSALNAVLDDIALREVNEIYCLGDLVGYYCYFNEVVEKISSLNIPCVMGNHDFAFAYNDGVIERSKTCTRILKWQLEHANNSTIEYIKSLPKSLVVNIGSKSIFCTHGGLIDSIDEYVFDVNEEYFVVNNFESDVLVTGHTHLGAYKSFFSGKKWINPGSVGQSRDFDNRASYVLINDAFEVQFIRVKYDFMKLVNQMKKKGFESYISDTLITGKKIGLF